MKPTPKKRLTRRQIESELLSQAWNEVRDGSPLDVERLWFLAQCKLEHQASVREVACMAREILFRRSILTKNMRLKLAMEPAQEGESDE